MHTIANIQKRTLGELFKEIVTSENSRESWTSNQLPTDTIHLPRSDKSGCFINF